MRLYLLRHAEAHANSPSDEERTLTEKGQRQSATVGRFCHSHGIAPSVILTSPYARAEETAIAVAAELPGTSVIVASFLASGMRPDVAIKELSGYLKFEEPMLVGHEPDLGDLIGIVVGSQLSDRFHVRKASLSLLDIDNVRTFSGRLSFSVPVKFM